MIFGPLARGAGMRTCAAMVPAPVSRRSTCSSGTRAQFWLGGRCFRSYACASAISFAASMAYASATCSEPDTWLPLKVAAAEGGRRGPVLLVGQDRLERLVEFHLGSGGVLGRAGRVAWGDVAGCGEGPGHGSA